MIEVEEVSKSFGVVKALEKVTFRIDRGEVVGFVGPNGAGKTTMMRILTCYLPADGGRVKVGGYDVLEDSLQVRSLIGYLPENAPLYADMTVEEYLDYTAAVRGIKPAERAAAQKKMLEVCGLETVLKKPIGELSKGYRQRVGLAQAMIHDPDILILDEPTSGLDPLQIREMRELMKALGREKTVILSTHILSEVEAACNRVIIIDQGRIVADGSLAEVMAKAERKNRYVMLVRGEEAKIDSALKTVAEVASFRQAGKEGGLWRYEIEARGDARLEEHLFRVVADEGLSLASLSRERGSLESAFVKLILGRRQKEEREAQLAAAG